MSNLPFSTSLCFLIPNLCFFGMSGKISTDQFFPWFPRSYLVCWFVCNYWKRFPMMIWTSFNSFIAFWSATTSTVYPCTHSFPITTSGFTCFLCFSSTTNSSFTHSRSQDFLLFCQLAWNTSSLLPTSSPQIPRSSCSFLLFAPSMLLYFFDSKTYNSYFLLYSNFILIAACLILFFESPVKTLNKMFDSILNCSLFEFISQAVNSVTRESLSSLVHEAEYFLCIASEDGLNWVC